MANSCFQKLSFRMGKFKNAENTGLVISHWLSTRFAIDFLGIWEQVYNPNFNYGEFATIKSQSGLNSFKISVKEFVERTNAISLQAKASRYDGTYAKRTV
ncbi:MAG: KilA-N domain-containing protein [Treponema sp.]|nr:KilA-N domain-containing protein [Treponema sp.]